MSETARDVGVEVHGTAAREAGANQVAHDLVLAIDRDRAAIRQAGHVDVVAASIERQIDTAVPHPFAYEPVADAGGLQEIHRALLQDACPDAVDDVLLASRLEDDRVDTLRRQQVSEHEPGRAGADDADLSTKGSHGAASQMLSPDAANVRGVLGAGEALSANYRKSIGIAAWTDPP